jgi:hypothetical protein
VPAIAEMTKRSVGEGKARELIASQFSKVGAALC